MNLVDLRIGVSGERAVSRKIGLAAEIIGDLRDVFDEDLHPFMLDHMKSQFASSGRHGGKPWASYDKEPKYTAYKIALVGHLDVLRWQKGGPFERLYPSLVDKTDVDHVWKTSGKSARFGTRVAYAGRLNQGGVGPFGESYPARKMLAMTDQQKKLMITTIQRGIVSRIGANALRRARVT